MVVSVEDRTGGVEMDWLSDAGTTTFGVFDVGDLLIARGKQEWHDRRHLLDIGRKGNLSSIVIVGRPDPKLSCDLQSRTKPPMNSNRFTE